jgi:filamentous hemagglutinin
MPKMGIAASGAEMIKVVPKGDGVSATSDSWMSQQQAPQVASMSPKQAGQMLGLPAYQAAKMLENGLDFYSISGKSGTTTKVFVYKVAGTAQGVVRSPGGAEQVIVPNRNDWTSDVLVIQTT